MNLNLKNHGHTGRTLMMILRLKLPVGHFTHRRPHLRRERWLQWRRECRRSFRAPNSLNHRLCFRVPFSLTVVIFFPPLPTSFHNMLPQVFPRSRIDESTPLWRQCRGGQVFTGGVQRPTTGQLYLDVRRQTWQRVDEYDVSGNSSSPATLSPNGDSQ